jgi:hypothetical protein
MMEKLFSLSYQPLDLVPRGQRRNVGVMCFLLHWLHRRLLMYSHPLDSPLDVAHHSGLLVGVHAVTPTFLESNKESQRPWEKCKENLFPTSKQDQDQSTALSTDPSTSSRDAAALRGPKTVL